MEKTQPAAKGQPQSDEIVDFLRAYTKEFLEEHSDEYSVLGTSRNEDSKSIDLDYLVSLVQAFNAKTSGDRVGAYKIEELVRKSEVVRRYQLPNTRWASLSEIEQLRLLADDRKYLGSTGYQFKHTRPPEDVGDALDNPWNSLGMGTSLITGLFLSFLSGYYACMYAISQELVVQVCIGLAFSMFYVVAEVVLLILYDYKLSKKKALEEKRSKSLRSEPPTAKSMSPPSKEMAHVISETLLVGNELSTEAQENLRIRRRRERI